MLSNENKTLCGVRCEVENCLYHSLGNYCHADSIKVEAPTASSRSETYCSTFKPDRNRRTI